MVAINIASSFMNVGSEREKGGEQFEKTEEQSEILLATFL